MKKTTAKKLRFKSMVAIGFAGVLLIGFMLNPSISYAYMTEVEGLHVYHNEALQPELPKHVKESIDILKASEIYDSDFQMELCMRASSFYPKVIERILGPDIIRAFSNKQVLLQPHTPSKNAVAWRGNTYNFVQVLAHAMTHNLQYNYHGFLGANPLGGHPEWKWEGYAEYVVLGKKYALKDLVEKYHQPNLDTYSFISLDDGDGTLRLHIRYMILTKYCLENKGLKYADFMEVEVIEDDLWQEINELYKSN